MVIMDCNIERMRDYQTMTYPEKILRSRHFNYFALCYANANAKFEIGQLTPVQRNEWRRQNSPQTEPNMQQLPKKNRSSIESAPK